MTGNTNVIAAPASFTHSVMRSPPATLNAVLWAFLGGGLAKSQNLVGPALTNIGAGPHYPPAGNYAAFTNSSNALECPVADQAGDFTVLCVARIQESTGLCSCVSNFYNSPSNMGFDLYLGNAQGLNVFLAAGGLNWGSNPMPMPIPHGAIPFKFYALARQASTGATLYDKTDGISQVATGTSGKALSTRNWQLGQNPAGTNNTGNVDLAFAGICYSYLDATAMEWAYQSVRQTLLLRGIKA